MAYFRELLESQQKVAMDAIRMLTTGLLLLLAATCEEPDNSVYIEPVNISNTPGRSEDPSCAVDSRGTIHVVWTDYTPGWENIYYAYKPADSAWSVPVSLTGNINSARNPALVAGPGDRVHLVWQGWEPGTCWRILYSHKDPGSWWSVPETISPVGPIHPEIAVDSAGRVHVCWSGLSWTMKDTNGTWTTPLRVAGGTAQRIASDPSGNVHLVWWGDSFEVWYATRPQGGQWTAPTRVSQFGDGTGGCIGLAVDRRGDAHIAWSPIRGAWKRGGMYRMRTADGQWGQQGCLFRDTMTAWVEVTCIVVGPDDEIIIPGTAPYPSAPEEKFYMTYIVKPPGGAWSDTIVCGLQKHDPYEYGVSFKAAICDNQGRLHIVGQKSPAPGQEEDIYYLKLYLKER